MRNLLIALALAPSISLASDGEQALKKTLDACMQSKNIDMCKSAKDSMKRIEKKLEQALDNYGLKESAIVMTSATKMLIERKVEIKTGSWDVININRSVIQIDEEKVFLKLEWSL